MIGIIIELILSWLLLKFIVKKDLAVLGLKVTRSRAKNLGTGFLLAAVSCGVYQIMSTLFADNSWVLNKVLSVQKVIVSIWWIVKSVIFEELIFRGALLYIAIEKLGYKKACILSAIFFGIYHWFSYNTFGNPVQMGIIFFMTGIFGFVLAISFAKTQSLYLPIGLHLGWNVFNILVFSNGPLGKQILVKANDNHLEGIISLMVFLFQIFVLPVMVYVYFRLFKIKQ